MIHKETFSQSAHDGIPFHVVVQYYDNDGSLHASYFKNGEDAAEFETELKEIENGK